MDLDHSPNGSFKVVSLWLWGIEDLNWVCAPKNTLGEGGGEGEEEREGKEEEEEEEEEKGKEEEEEKKEDHIGFYCSLCSTPRGILDQSTCTVESCLMNTPQPQTADTHIITDNSESLDYPSIHFNT